MDPISELEREWPALAAGPLARAHRRWRATAPALEPFASPELVVAFLQRSSADSADEPLHALLSLAAADPAAARVCLQTILPSLKALAVRIVHPREAHDDLRAILLAAGWESVRRYPLHRRQRVAANLVLQVLHDASRELRRLRDRLGIQAPEAMWAAEVELERIGCPRASLPSLGVEGLVAAAGIGEPDRELILATRVDGVALARLARARGVGEAALLKRRQRAETRLRAALVETGRVRNGGRPVLTSDETSRRPAPRRPDARPESGRPAAPAGPPASERSA